MTMQRWQRGLLLAVLVAGTACAARDDSEPSDPEPSEEEIESVQMSYCELADSCGALSPEITIENCVENLRNVYAFSEECFELRYAWNSCAVDLAANITSNDPSAHVCDDVFGNDAAYGPCGEKRGEADTVSCNG